MKKFITLALFTSMLCTLAGCGEETVELRSVSSTSNTNTSTDNLDSSSALEEATGSDLTAAQGNESVQNTVVADSTPDLSSDSNSGTSESESDSSVAPVESEADSSSVAPVESEVDSSVAPVESEIVFKSGAWYSYSDEYCGYYIFYNDSTDGRYADVTTGTGAPFKYEAHNGVVFHKWSADDNSPATVVVDGDHATIYWEESGLQENLTYISSETDNFTFYTDDELCSMAISYYGNSTGADTSFLQCGIQSNSDGTATMQIYENLGDHNSTADWYTVDRVTAVGTNILGEQIDLK